jgi:hypothetical protein
VFSPVRLTGHALLGGVRAVDLSSCEVPTRLRVWHFYWSTGRSSVARLFMRAWLRASLWLRKTLGAAPTSSRTCPYALETIEIGVEHIAATDPAEARDRSVSGGKTVGVLVYEELVVRPVDRVVQDGLVKPDLDVVERAKRAVQRKRIADSREHGIIDGFLAEFRDLRDVRVSERDPDGDADVTLVGEDAQDVGVFGEEQGAVGKDADLVFGRGEEPRPHIAGNRRTARVDRS